MCRRWRGQLSLGRDTVVRQPRPIAEQHERCGKADGNDGSATARSEIGLGVEGLAGQRFEIDRASPVPLWFQAAQHLEHAIERGDLPPGTHFENEILLADRLGVSRPTMRRASRTYIS